jgi:hypothetical protein
VPLPPEPAAPQGKPLKRPPMALLWEPWPSNLAAHLFLARMNELQTPSNQGRTDGWCRHVHPY